MIAKIRLLRKLEQLNQKLVSLHCKTVIKNGPRPLLQHQNHSTVDCVIILLKVKKNLILKQMTIK